VVIKNARSQVMYVNWFIEAIDKLPQEKLRVIELPKQFNLLEFMRTFERLVRAGVTITAPDQVLTAMEIK
jgi:hypothetical protein